jgi:hypothetical protein
MVLDIVVQVHSQRSDIARSIHHGIRRPAGVGMLRLIGCTLRSLITMQPSKSSDDVNGAYVNAMSINGHVRPLFTPKVRIRKSSNHGV